MMQTLSEEELLKQIELKNTFEAEVEGGSFIVRIRKYVPYVCTAIHAGHNLRSSLVDNCLVNEKDRLLEEDPYTNQLIGSFPIVLIAQDSRYEYDLNRNRKSCIYEDAWGKKVWRDELSSAEKDISLAKYDQYYRILKALLSALEKEFGGCLLMDTHSYNWQVRKYAIAPVFNIGTAQIDVPRYEKTLKILEKKLSLTKLPNIAMETMRDKVFYGKGHQAAFINNNLSNVLIIPLEIKKIFMDELSGELFPLVLEKMQEGLYVAVLEAAYSFNKTLQKSRLKRADLLLSSIDPIIIEVDKSLHRLARGFDTLNYVNPTNLLQEKRKFLASNDYNPEFSYRQLRVDPYSFKEKLYKLPVSDIHDPMIRSLYRAVIDSYSSKVDMLASVGTTQFLYNSLRYYGEPSSVDIDNANFILHAKELTNSQSHEHKICAADAKVIFEQAAKDMGLTCKVMLSNRTVSKAMVDNARQTLLINRNILLSQFEINALIHHELGVHMVTTINALSQPLYIFKLGLPGNTHTQEGLAILSEYLSGNLDLSRLKQLSLRVIAVGMMIKGMSFRKVYKMLLEDYQMPVNEAFSLTTRVFRGGGFTKDYLYLKGFRDVVALYKTKNITSLLIGKTGIEFHQIIDSLIARKLLNKPILLPPVLRGEPIETNPVLNYLISCIK